MARPVSRPQPYWILEAKLIYISDTAFFQAFLLTFRSFTSGDDLLDLLLERYNIQPPARLDSDEMNDWKKQKQTPIKLR